MKYLEMLSSWTPTDGIVIETIDAHTGGEPLRIVCSSTPLIQGKTILEKRRYIREHHDSLRTALMWEPRGHADMYGCIVVEPERADSDIGVLFLHNEGFSTMCGHGIIGLAAVLRQCGVISNSKKVLKIDSPAGQIVVLYSSDSPYSATFLNVASFVDTLDTEIDVAEIGKIQYDLAFGGAYYAFVDAESLGLRCEKKDAPALVKAAGLIKKAINSARSIQHPLQEDLGFLYGVIFTSTESTAGTHSKHVCVFADGEVDRSPTGTGVSARAALLHARGEMKTGESIKIESIIGSSFDVSLAAVTEYAGRAAVIPEVTGTAFITGKHKFVINTDDPFASGFLLR